MATRRFELRDEKSNKFWEISVEASSHTVRFGRIGTTGQSKTKDFASPDAARADADKLISQKVKKGYEEVAGEGAPEAAGAGPGAAFADHFAFLCAGAEDRALLEELAGKVTSFEIGADGSAHAVLLWSDKEHELTCEPPFSGQPAAGIPATYAAIAARHNGISWHSYGGGPLGFPGLDDDGRPDGFGFWEWEALEEGDNDELVAQLEKKGLALEELQEAFGSGQNWILFDPLRTTATGEMALAFVGHDSCEWQPVESTQGVGYGTVLLWQLADYFLDKELIEDTYN